MSTVFIFNISTSYRLHLSIFHHVIYLLILYGKRRKRDLNPRTAINDLLPFQGSPFSHLGISPKRLSFFWHKKTTDDWLVVFLTQRVGFEPTRPFGQTVFKTASLWPLRYLSKRAFIFYIRQFVLSSTFLSFFEFYLFLI